MKTIYNYKPNKPLLIAFAEEIRRTRKSKGLTIEEFADLCGLHSKYIQTIERNHRNISISVFVQIANGLKVSPAKLLGKLLKAAK